MVHLTHYNTKLGFKGKTCMDRHCICCSTEPPTLSSKVIRSLGKTLCRISPGVISEEALLHKPKTAIKKQAGNKKGKADGSRKDNDDDKPQKKTKRN